MEPVITNERGQREWLYIINHVGLERAQQAMTQLGTKRAYPLNIARVLKLILPEEQYLPELEGVRESRIVNGQQALVDIKKILNG